MTTQLQALWSTRFERLTEGVILSLGSPDGPDVLGTEPIEGGFSPHRCDTCNGPAGDRYAASSPWNGGEDWIGWSVCVDCVQWIANAELPDDESIRANHPDLAEEAMDDFIDDEGPWVDPDFGPEPDHPDDAAWDAQWDDE